MGLSTRDLNDKAADEGFARAALVVIGMQRARLTGADADAHVRRVAGLVDRARRDGTQVVFVQHTGGDQSSEAWRLVDGLRAQFPDWVIDKSQSSIFDDTNLSAQLRAVGISRLVLAGPPESADVVTSCTAALGLGFDAVLAEDLIDAAVIDQVRCGAETADCV